jgi:D-serine deaminase-like pyridoxal phosphate-dependent protein
MPTVHELATPALVVERDALEHNLVTLARALPRERLRPHVKAHKCIALARRQQLLGHRGFTCATPRELVGLAEAGLGDDLLLANEVVDPDRLRQLARLDARVTVAIDSEATAAAAAAAGLVEVLIDVNVGLPRCGCAPEAAGALADRARALGLEVRGVMGYEGHCVGIPDRAKREELCNRAMDMLLAAHRDVGGSVISAGGTGTYDCNRAATEIQAGSYVLMDTAYQKLELPLRQALHVIATVISVSDGFSICDAGLKSLGMDHGNPEIENGEVLFCSDEHITFKPQRPLRVGERVRVVPAHCDPTVAYHERLHLIDGERVLESWEVDLRGW